MGEVSEKIVRKLLVCEMAENIRLGKLVHRLERRIRRLKRKSARQHQVLTAIKRLNRADMRRRGLDV